MIFFQNKSRKNNKGDFISVLFRSNTIFGVSAIFSGTGKYFSIYNAVLAFMVSDFVVMLADAVTSD